MDGPHLGTGDFCRVAEPVTAPRGVQAERDRVGEPEVRSRGGRAIFGSIVMVASPRIRMLMVG